MARRALATWIRRRRVCQPLPCKGVMILRYPVLCVNGVQNKVAIAHESNHVPRLITNNMDHTEGENPHEFTNDVDIEPMEIDAVDIDPVDLHEPYDEETTPSTPRPTPDVDDVMHSAVDRQHNSAMYSAVDRQHNRQHA